MNKIGLYRSLAFSITLVGALALAGCGGGGGGGGGTPASAPSVSGGSSGSGSGTPQPTAQQQTTQKYSATSGSTPTAQATSAVKRAFQIALWESDQSQILFRQTQYVYKTVNAYGTAKSCSNATASCSSNPYPNAYTEPCNQAGTITIQSYDGPNASDPSVYYKYSGCQWVSGGPVFKSKTDSYDPPQISVIQHTSGSTTSYDYDDDNIGWSPLYSNWRPDQVSSLNVSKSTDSNGNTVYSFDEYIADILYVNTVNGTKVDYTEAFGFDIGAPDAKGSVTLLPSNTVSIALQKQRFQDGTRASQTPTYYAVQTTSPLKIQTLSSGMVLKAGAGEIEQVDNKGNPVTSNGKPVTDVTFSYDTNTAMVDVSGRVGGNAIPAGTTVSPGSVVQRFGQ